MFRLFLRKKLFSGDVATKPETSAPPANTLAPKRDRRVFARYNIDHKHLTLMNEQDILLVREVSAKGFSTEVSARGYERLTIGDIYEARVRYLGEVYDMQAKVIWKHDTVVGFEIVKAARETLNFLKRLLRPIEIAWSLAPVEAAFMKDAPEGQSSKQWFHGDNETDLYVWHDTDTNDVTAWQLASGETYVEWNASRGLTTGAVVSVKGRESLLGANLQGLTHKADTKPDDKKRQFAVDVIMALQDKVREDILETFTS